MRQVSLITGPVCDICGLPVQNNVRRCEQCSASAPVFAGMRSWAEYKDTLRESIHSLKYKNNIPLGYFFSQKLVKIVETTSWDFDLVLPVPLNPFRLKERGFNQSALIGKPLAHSLGVPFDQKSLLRIKNTSPQYKLSAQKRQENVFDAFWGNPDRLKGKGVLIVDDIITTGATMENCNKALLAAGASRVFCISIARVL